MNRLNPHHEHKCWRNCAPEYENWKGHHWKCADTKRNRTTNATYVRLVWYYTVRQFATKWTRTRRHVKRKSKLYPFNPFHVPLMFIIVVEHTNNISQIFLLHFVLFFNRILKKHVPNVKWLHRQTSFEKFMFKTSWLTRKQRHICQSIDYIAKEWPREG